MNIPKDIVRRFFSGTARDYDLVVNLFTYGADRYWKKRMRALVPRGTRILDLACGTGILTFKLAADIPDCQIVGVDMMPEYIALAKEKQETYGRSNIQFICARAEEVKLRQSFDCVTSSYIPKYVSPYKLLENISTHLREGGAIVLHDFTFPQKLIFQKIWGLHVFLMKYLGTPVFPVWRTIFYELGDLIRSTQWLPNYLDALGRFGYRNIQTQTLTAGSASIIYAERGP